MKYNLIQDSSSPCCRNPGCTRSCSSSYCRTHSSRRLCQGSHRRSDMELALVGTQNWSHSEVQLHSESKAPGEAMLRGKGAGAEEGSSERTSRLSAWEIPLVDRKRRENVGVGRWRSICRFRGGKGDYLSRTAQLNDIPIFLWIFKQRVPRTSSQGNTAFGFSQRLRVFSQHLRVLTTHLQKDGLETG